VVALANLSVSILVLLLCLAAPFLVGSFVRKHFYRFKDHSDADFHRTWSCLFDEFKHNQGKVCSSFYVLHFSRRLLFLAERSPITQVCLSLVLACLMSGFVLLFKPFAEPLLNFSNFYSECSICLTFALCGVFLTTSVPQQEVCFNGLCLGQSSP
jgi:hypothetical protein